MRNIIVRTPVIKPNLCVIAVKTDDVMLLYLDKIPPKSNEPFRNNTSNIVQYNIFIYFYSSKLYTYNNIITKG